MARQNPRRIETEARIRILSTLIREYSWQTRLAGAFAVVAALLPGFSSAQQPYPYYPPAPVAAQRLALPYQYGPPFYQNAPANYPVVAYDDGSQNPANSAERPAPLPQYYGSAVQTAYAEGYGDNRSQIVPATQQLTLRDPADPGYSTEIVRPLPANNFANSSQPENGYRVAQTLGAPEVLRPGPAMVQADQAANPQPAASAENRFQGLLPAAGPPPALGPLPTPQAERAYDHYVEGKIEADNTLRVVVGRAIVLVTREKPRRIYVPNEDYATCQVVTDRQIAIVGKKEGRTTLDLWFPDPRDPNDPSKDRALSYMIVVLHDTVRDEMARWEQRRQTENEVEAYKKALEILQSQIKEAFPDSAVRLSMVGEQVVVHGEAKDVVEAAQILSIVAEHAPVSNRRRGIGSYAGTNGRGNVNVNLGLAAGGENTALNALQQSLNPGVNLSLNAGPGQEQAALNAIQQILTGAPNVVNLLRIPGEQQVMLIVTVAEVDRTAARTIGLDFSIVHGGFAFAQNSGGGVNVGNATGTSSSNTNSAVASLASVGGNLPTAIDNGNVLLAIKALRTLDFARSLAEPNLTTLNGRPANFLAGGSFPIPNSVVLPGGAAQSVSYQNFGVSLQFTPYITDRDRIRLQLNASVSTPSTATTSVNGAQVPSQISQRQFNTTVEMREGQTLTVAGLIQNNFSGTSNRVPLWGDLPIIGRTGGSDGVTSGEQELVVLVTPVLVHPLEQCKTPSLPGNDVFEPGDIEFYLMGHLEGTRSEDYRTSVRTDFARQKKWCECDDIYIIGPRGATYGCCRCGNTCSPAPQPQPQAQQPQARPTAGPPASAALPPPPSPPETVPTPRVQY